MRVEEQKEKAKQDYEREQKLRTEHFEAVTAKKRDKRKKKKTARQQAKMRDQWLAKLQEAGALPESLRDALQEKEIGKELGKAEPAKQETGKGVGGEHPNEAESRPAPQ